MKLLHKTTGLYLLLSVGVFVASIPIFYTIVERLWIEDVDESLVFQKEKISRGVSKYNITPETIDSLSIFLTYLDVGIEIKPADGTAFVGDSIYYLEYFDEVRGHVEPFRVLKTQIDIGGSPYELIISKDLVENEDLLAGVAFVQAILFFILLALIMTVITIYSKRIWRPFYKITEQLKRVRLNSREDIYFDKTSVSEFKDLQKSVEYLVHKNREIFVSQKEFTENASHEMQTPLAAIKNHTDILLSTPGITAKQMVCIEGINRNIRYVTNLNKNLLLLSKIDNRQFAKDETVDISHIITDICSQFEEEAAMLGKSIVSNIGNGAILTTNEILVKSLLTNLVVNAIQHSRKDSEIIISFAGDMLEVSNTAGGKALPVEKIFNRFYKHDGNSGGSGLGLAIVQRICGILEYKVSYGFTAPDTHSFRVELS